MDIVSINFKSAWEMSQKCRSATCASKTYDNIFCINFRAVDGKEEEEEGGEELNAKSTRKSV